MTVVSSSAHEVAGVVVASRLETALGDPRTDAGLIRFADVVASEDITRVTPEVRRAVLDDHGLAFELVPEMWGGAGGGPSEVAAQLRALFRRDAAAGAELGGLAALAAAGVWTQPAAGLVARELLSLRPIAVAVEAGEIASDPQTVAWRVSGVLPLVAVPLESRCVVVRRGAAATLIGLDGALAVVTPRSTTGLRGLRFCALELRDAPVLATWNVDPAGDDQAQAMLASAWCGTVDTALRLAVPYARGRALYGGAVWDLPHARGLVAGAFADLLLADAIAAAALSGRHVSALELVPTLLGDAMRALSVLFGSTFFARVEPYELVETLVRDVTSMRLISTPRHRMSTATPGDGVELFEEAAESLEKAAAGAPAPLRRAVRDRLAARRAGRRDALQADAIEHLATEVDRRAAADTSLTFDNSGVFASRTERTTT